MCEPRRGDSKCKGPEAETGWKDYSKSTRASMVGPPGTASEVMGRVWISFSVIRVGS